MLANFMATGLDSGGTRYPIPCRLPDFATEHAAMVMESALQ